MHRQIFWSGGLGDIFALEATFTDDYRKSIGRMYWATRSRSQMAPLFTRFPNYPYLKEHLSLWESFDNGLCFKTLEDAFATTLHQHLVVGPVEDWSVFKHFYYPQPFTYNSFIKYNHANISSFNLPEEYIVICPYSNVNKPSIQEWKRFLEKDWEWLFKHLSKKKVYGVVLNAGDDFVPENKWLIDLSNKTKLTAAIEIVKSASGYIGIDMAFSVLAAQLMPAEKMIVKTRNVVLWGFKHVYYAPKTEWDFIVPCLGATEKEIKDWRDEFGVINPPLCVEEAIDA
jgi:hypothetical protein